MQIQNKFVNLIWLSTLFKTIINNSGFVYTCIFLSMVDMASEHFVTNFADGFILTPFALVWYYFYYVEWFMRLPTIHGFEY